jgi:predicted DCC family thiol-disulfide oxidoreductase YuxK
MIRTTSAPHSDRAVVLYDGECAFCRKSISLLKRLDWGHKLRYQNCRETAKLPKTDPPLQPHRMIEEMHLVTSDHREVYAGFKAFRWIAARLPLFWAFVPMMYLPGVPELGQKMYLWVAKNRFNLVPCHDGVCQLPLRKTA